MNIPAHLVAIVIALVAFVYGVKVILRARKHLKYWDEFSKSLLFEERKKRSHPVQCILE